jgi:hemoglobin-like flavoprotein
VTPDELAIVERDAAVVTERADGFSREFYDTLFDLAPDSRSLFPDDMAAQRRKLTDELLMLVDTAVASRAGGLGSFVTRTHDLGARHASYGVTGAMYEAVGVALRAALRQCVEGFDDAHEAAWSKLYRLVADTMREGVSDRVGVTDRPRPHS